MNTVDWTKQQKPLGDTLVGGEMIDLTVIIQQGGLKSIFVPMQKTDGYGYELGLTLDQIAAQVKEVYKGKVTIKVVEEAPTSGRIWLWGAHGEVWEKSGTTRGYA